MKTEISRMAAEAYQEIERMTEIESLFKKLETKQDPEERKAIEDEIRSKLKEYRRAFGRTATDPYYERLDISKKAA